MAKTLRLHESPLYRLTSKKKLAALFGVKVADIKFLRKLDGNYRVWPLKQKHQDVLAGMPVSDKVRMVQQPKPTLDAFQRRLAKFLGAIEKPDYVYSATKKRSYLENALVHRHSQPALKVDIRSFYPSVKRRAVKSFFEEQLGCAEDVAHVLSELCCHEGKLPTGSALSPVLSYFSCAPMFARIAALADAKGLRFTLYVDDMVFSGTGLDDEFLAQVLNELNREGYSGHKVRFYKAKRPKVITGAVVWPSRVDVPHKRRWKMRLYERALKVAKPEDKAILGRALLGQYRESSRINPSFKVAASRLQKFMDDMGGKTKAAKPRKRPRGRSSYSLFLSRISRLRAEVAAARTVAGSAP